MGTMIRLLSILPLIAALCCSRSYAQTDETNRGSFPDRVLTAPFDHSSDLRDSDLPIANALSSLPPQHSNENWEGGLGMPGLDGDVRALVWKDGQLYVGGEFINAGGLYTQHVARWDGTAWHPLGTTLINGVDGDVRAIAVEGDKVYVGGEFTQAGGIKARNIAVWDRTTNRWSALGGGVGGVFGSVINAITVHNGQVYVAGRFIAAGSTVAVNIARWDGSKWHRVGTGLNNTAHALYADGNILYAAGAFTIAGNLPSTGLARFNTASGLWENTGATVSGTVSSMTADSRYLYIGGLFETVNGRLVKNIARMDKGTGEWSALGQGFVGQVRSILLRGSEVIVGGEMFELFGQTLPSGYDVRRIAKWDGERWSVFARRSAASGRNHGSSGVIKASRAESIDDPDVMIRDNGEGIVFALALGNNNELYIGGSFDVAGPAYVVPVLRPAAMQIIPDPEMVVATNLCKLTANDTVWTTLGGGLNHHVYAIADAGSSLYLGGKFIKAGERQANHIVRFFENTHEWEVLGEGVNGDVLALALDGTRLYAGGLFKMAGGNQANGLALWNTSSKSWSRVGDRDFDSVTSLAVVDGDLYVGGKHGLARWDGTAWSSLYDGARGPVAALHHNDGILYVGGTFSTIGAVTANNVAALNLVNGLWSPLGSGTSGPVFALSMWDDLLCVGGNFTQAGSTPARSIATWSPSTGWEGLGVGINGTIRAITPGRFGLYAAGRFNVVESGLSANAIGLWNGTSWQTLGNGVLELISYATVHALAAREDHLYVGGTLQYAGGKASFYLARWNYPPLSEILGVEDGILPPFYDSIPRLFNIYPNPVTDRSKALFWLPEQANVSAAIYDLSGRQVATSLERTFNAGMNDLPLNTEELSNGFYLFRIRMGEKMDVRSIIVNP